MKQYKSKQQKVKGTRQQTAQLSKANSNYAFKWAKNGTETKQESMQEK